MNRPPVCLMPLWQEDIRRWQDTAVVTDPRHSTTSSSFWGCRGRRHSKWNGRCVVDPKDYLVCDQPPPPPPPSRVLFSELCQQKELRSQLCPQEELRSSSRAKARNVMEDIRRRRRLWRVSQISYISWLISGHRRFWLLAYIKNQSSNSGCIFFPM